MAEIPWEQTPSTSYSSKKPPTSTPKNIHAQLPSVSPYGTTLPNKTLVDKSINTTDDIDLNFQLTAITDRGIELEQTMQEKDKVNKSDLEEKCVLGHAEHPSFHTQILIGELKRYKLEVENLNKIIEFLEKDKVNLEKLVQERNTSGTACMYYFPLGNFEEASSSKS